MDEFRIWNTARTESEIQSYNESNSLNGNEPGLVGYWKFDEGPGQQQQMQQVMEIMEQLAERFGYPELHVERMKLILLSLLTLNKIILIPLIQQLQSVIQFHKTVK